MDGLSERALTSHALPQEAVACSGIPLEAFHSCLLEALGLLGEPLGFQLPRSLTNRGSAAQGKRDAKRS